jgi:hypothetical protein
VESSLIFFFFGGYGVGTQGFHTCREALHHLSYGPDSLALVIFLTGSCFDAQASLNLSSHPGHFCPGLSAPVYRAGCYTVAHHGSTTERAPVASPPCPDLQPRSLWILNGRWQPLGAGEVWGLPWLTVTSACPQTFKH